MLAMFLVVYRREIFDGVLLAVAVAIIFVLIEIPSWVQKSRGPELS